MRKTVFVLTMIALAAGSTGVGQAPNTRVKASPAKTPTPGPLAAPVVLANETKIDAALVFKIANATDQPLLRDEFMGLRKKADYVLGFQWSELYYACYEKFTYLKRCGQESFNANDQKAAGCLPTETVQACSEKLLKWCVYNRGVGDRWRSCRERRPPLLKELDSLEQEIRVMRAKVAAYATY